LNHEKDPPLRDRQSGRHPTENKASDEAGLLLRVARQDWQAFDQLYRLYYRRLTRFLEKMTRRPSLIDEVLDDTMLVVWQKAQTFNAESRVSTWIFAIAYRKALKALEREHRHLGIDVPADHLDEPSHFNSGPEPDLEALQSRQLIDGLLMQLSPEHRAVIELTYFHGCPYEEIASIVGSPVATIKTRMFYARRKLRSLLIEQGHTGV
jgi:RNA polymerase sigma factor (sigma-70 family)